MTPTIESGGVFQDATPAQLYEFFMDSKKHRAATGMPAKISPKVGGKWSAFGGMILGKTLALVPNRMIVQAWRSSEGKKPIPIPFWLFALKNPRAVAQPWRLRMWVCPNTIRMA